MPGSAARGAVGSTPQTTPQRPATQRALAEFSAVSGLEIQSLVVDAPDAALFADRAWQLAVVAPEVAAFEAFRAAGRVVSGTLAFSIGACAALQNAGMVDASQVVAMVDSVLEACLALAGSCGMAAVAGPSGGRVEKDCRPGAVEIAAVLGPGQVLAAGELEATERVCAGISNVALRVTRLPVPWPLHATMMTPVAAALERRRKAIGRLRPLRHPVYSGLDGSRITGPSEGWDLLVRHLVRPQPLDLAIPAVLAAGAAGFVELGPGATLTRAVRRFSGSEASVESFPVSRGGPLRGARSRC